MRILVILLLLGYFIVFVYGSVSPAPTLDMNNVFRYSKRLSKKMAPSISAVLMECPRLSVAPSCERKIMVNIRVSPDDQTCKTEKYLVLDEIYDQRKQTRAKLMSPYLIELTRGEPVLMYPLEFVKGLECNSCNTFGNKARKSTEDGFKGLGGTANLVKSNKINMPGLLDKSLRGGSISKGLRSLARTHLNRDRQKSKIDDEDEEKDTNINIDIALNDETDDQDGRGDDFKWKRIWRENNHDGVKRNSDETEKITNEQFDYDTAQNYDEMFEQLEQKNEKIKKDILEILKPSLLSSNDRKNESVEKQNHNCNNCKDDNNTSTSTCICKCPKCPTLPPLPMKKMDNKCFVGRAQLGPAQLQHQTFGPGRAGISHRMMMSNMFQSKRNNRRGGSSMQKIVMKEPKSDDLPIQDTSDDSSNPDDAEFANNKDNREQDPNAANEEVEDLFSSVDNMNDDLFSQNQNADKNDKDIETNMKNSFVRQNNALLHRVNFDKSLNNIAPSDRQSYNEISWEKSKFNPDNSGFARYHPDPTNYGNSMKYDINNMPIWGSDNSVQFYKTLTGRHSPFYEAKTNRKKDAQFVSYINGYGLNVDSTELLNNTGTLVNLHEPPMPKLHHYFMHLEAPTCPKCENSQNNKLSGDPLSSIVEVPPRNAFDSKSLKNPTIRMCPYGQVFPPVRPISTSKISPIQQIQLKSSSNENNIMEWSPPYSGFNTHPKGIKAPSGFYSKNVDNTPSSSFHTGTGVDIIPVKDPESRYRLQKIHPDAKFLPHNTGDKFEDNSFNKDDRFNPDFKNDNRLKTGFYKDDRFGDGLNKDGRMSGRFGNQFRPSYSNPGIFNRGNDLMKFDSKKFAKKPQERENKAKNYNSDGDEYDYYDEQTSDLSNFPDVIAQRPQLKFPGIYQKPGKITGIPLESDDSSCEEGDLPQKRDSMNRREFKRVRAPKHRGLNEHRPAKYEISPDSSGPTPTEILLSQVNHNYLPDRVPYENILGDPNLSTFDKMRLMELIDPQDERLEGLLRHLETEVQSSYIPYYITKPEREQMQPVAGQSSKDIVKRSFSVYDDMEVRDTDVNYDGPTATRHLPVFDSFEGSESSLSSSHSCGTGASSKATNKNACGCKTESTKRARSVEDIWYSVFNMSAPLQFLTTRVRIFRKKENSWWRIAPSITLTSLSGIYANANLSILFSSHVELYSLEKPLPLKNYKLLMPSKANTANITPCEILAMDESKFDLGTIDKDESVKQSICEAAQSKLTSDSDEDASNVFKRHDDNGIHSLEDFGYFPASMNVMEHCKNDPDHLCLNMLDDETPAYKVTVQIPFRENSLVYKDFYKVRITNVIVDGSVAGAVQVITTFISEALLSQELDIVIADCPVTCGAKNVVHKIVPPHKGVTIAFFLPLQESNPNTKHYCEVQIKTPSNVIVSRRQMVIQPTLRCLCIWHCNCRCIQDIVSSLVSEMCGELPNSEEKKAGFEKVDEQPLTWEIVFGWLLLFLILLLVLGLMKACLGCCIACIGRWRYNYVQPLNRYDDATRCRRFAINSIFFISFPFVVLCKCFQPTEEDMLLSTTSWECSVVQHQIDSDLYDDTDEEEQSKDNVPFVERQQRLFSGDDSDSRNTNIYYGTSGGQEYLFEAYNDEGEERDMKYVLNALEESRQSFKLLDAHKSEPLSPNDKKGHLADALVKRLLTAKIVYRTFTIPIDKADIPEGQCYSMRGYFVPLVGTQYQFFTHSVLQQHWAICPHINSLQGIFPPRLLQSNDFSRIYANKMEVLEAGDLSLHPNISAPCINVLYQNISLYDKPDEEDEEQPEPGCSGYQEK